MIKVLSMIALVVTIGWAKKWISAIKFLGSILGLTSYILFTETMILFTLQLI
ncbi:hypothetical protein [Heyndrickxia acidicola]|uniref:Uncharacterized protein n=1 Tax=Heyndrickxia acidicola TaxID=209389 RepID=A0ABU6MNN7_9BACI|nr:hypothetical protein [Heyndrickxia acidicola]MED1205596.1 hypothetical protein [Heyndrickxia acidicola]